MNIGTVVEGPTDRLVLEAVLDRLLPADQGGHRYFPLQPTPTFGQTGTGWKGVRRWCKQTWQFGSSLEQMVSGAAGPPLDLLVIHVDASIAGEPDLQEEDADPVAEVQAPCPPASATADRLGLVLARWLACECLPPEVVLAIPAQDMETWTFAALFPADALCARPDYECIRTGHDHPAYRLSLERYGKLLSRQGTQLKKPVRAYRRVVRQAAGRWQDVRAICTQADRFTCEILRLEADL